VTLVERTVLGCAATHTPPRAQQPGRSPCGWRTAWRARTEEAQVVASAGWDVSARVATCGAGEPQVRVWTACGWRAQQRTQRTAQHKAHTSQADTPQGAPQLLVHPAPVLSATWRPSGGAPALLTWSYDGCARLWADAPLSSAACASAPFSSAAAAHRRLTLVASLQPQPLAVGPLRWAAVEGGVAGDDGRDHPISPGGCGGALLTAFSADGALHVWAVLRLDDPQPRCAVLCVHVARGAPGLAASCARGASINDAQPQPPPLLLLLRRHPSSSVAALPCAAHAWGVDAAGRGWHASEALLPEAPLCQPQPQPQPQQGPASAAASSLLAAPPASCGLRAAFTLPGHSCHVTALCCPPGAGADCEACTDDVLAVSLDVGGCALLWRSSCRGEASFEGPLPLFPSAGGAATAVVSPAPSLFVLAAQDGLAAYALRGRRTRTVLATATQLGGSAVRHLAALPCQAVASGGAAGGVDCVGGVAALTHDGASVTVWAISLPHTQALAAHAVAHWNMPFRQLLSAAPPAASSARRRQPFALATAGADGAVHLWAPPPMRAEDHSVDTLKCGGGGPSIAAWISVGRLSVCEGTTPRLLGCAPGGELLCVVSHDQPGAVRVWGCQLASQGGARWREEALLCGSDAWGNATTLAWLHAGAAPQLLAVAHELGVRVWSKGRTQGGAPGGPACWTPLASLAAPQHSVQPHAALAWHPHGALLLGCGTQVWGLAPTMVPQDADHGNGDGDGDGGVAHGPSLTLVAVQRGGALAAWHPGNLAEALRGCQLPRAAAALRALARHLKAGGACTGPHPLLAMQLPCAAQEAPHSSPSRAFAAGIFAPGGAVAADDEEEGARVESASSPEEDASRVPFSAAEAAEVAKLVGSASSAQLRGLDRGEALHLLAALDAVADAQAVKTSAIGALDVPARRCVAELGVSKLREVCGHAPGAAAARARAAAWAVHSCTVEALLGATGPAGTSSAGGTTWALMCASSAPLWLPSLFQLRAAVEAAARGAYLARKDPGDCAALYCALGRPTVLGALYKSCGDAQMPPFLNRDFLGEQRHRTAAAKNAYALLGKGHTLLACAFFMLAGAPGDAAGLAARRMEDPMLGVAIARLADGQAGSERAWGPLTEALLRSELLPAAALAGDCFTQHALLWRLGRTQEAVDVLIAATEGGEAHARCTGCLAHAATLAELLKHLAGCAALRTTHPQLAAACIAAVPQARMQAACAAEAEGLPLQALQWLSESEGGAAVQPAMTHAHRDAFAARLAAQALWPRAAHIGASWRDDAARELAAIGHLLPPSLHGEHQEDILELLERTPRLSAPPPAAPPAAAAVTPLSLSPVGPSVGRPLSPHTPVAGLPAAPPPPPVGASAQLSRRAASLLTPLGSTLSALRLPSAAAAAFASAFAAAGDASSPLHRSASAPTLHRGDALLQGGGGLELQRYPGELLRGCCLLAGPQCATGAPYQNIPALAVLTLRSGLHTLRLPVASQGGAALARAAGPGQGDAPGWAVHSALTPWAGSSCSPHPTPPRGYSSGVAPTTAPSELHARCCAFQPRESGLLACGGSAQGGGVSLWQVSPSCGAPGLRAQLPWAGTAGVGAAPGAGPPAWCCAWDGEGARLAAGFADGTLALWHPAHHPGAALAPAAQLGAFPGGVAAGLCFLSPSVVVAAGSGAEGHLVLWDVLCPPRTARVASFAAHAGAAGAACVARCGSACWSVLTAGAAAGDVARFDLRAAAASGAAVPLWRAPAGGAPAACLAVAAWGGPGPADGVVLAGDRAGDLRLLDARTGGLLQHVPAAHPRQLFAPPQRLGGSSIVAGVTAVLPLPGGALTCGADGAIKLHRRANTADE